MGFVVFSKPVAHSDIDLTWMVGRKVVVELLDPALWVFVLGDRTSITAECPWRILKDSRIACSSEDHGQKYGLPAPIDAAVEATRLLGAHCVEKALVLEGSADLVLEFSDRLVLQIIPISSGYESWQVTEPSGSSLIAQGGGQICRCERPS